MKEKEAKEMVMDYVDEILENDEISGAIISIKYETEDEEDERDEIAVGSNTFKSHHMRAAEILVGGAQEDEEPKEIEPATPEKQESGTTGKYIG